MRFLTHGQTDPHNQSAPAGRPVPRALRYGDGTMDGYADPRRGVVQMIARTTALAATAALLAFAAFAPSASATEPNPDCDGVNWSASVAAGENAYPMLTVT